MLDVLIRPHCDHQPHVGGAYSITVGDVGHPFHKRIVALQYVEANSRQLLAYQARVDFVGLDLIRPGFGSMCRETVVRDDQASSRFEHSQNLLVHGLILFEMMIGVHHQHSGERVSGQSSFTTSHVSQIEHFDPLI